MTIPAPRKDAPGKKLPARIPSPAAAETSAAGDTNEDRKPSHVTSIRHWSNPEYSRVTIGLEKDIKFESQRIDHPERIFFDLLDTNLTSTLLGKTFDVDDSLLKKIRVAQFQPGKSRIVLEVADHSDYTTSLLTDPPRLIIEIRNKDVQSKDIQAGRATPETPLKESVTAEFGESEDSGRGRDLQTASGCGSQGTG